MHLYLIAKYFFADMTAGLLYLKIKQVCPIINNWLENETYPNRVYV